MKLYELTTANGKLFSPPCWRIRLALQMHGLDYESIPVGYTDIPAIRGPNEEQFKTVPILCNEALGLSDSWQIINYLDTAYAARGKFFRNAVEKAQSQYMQKVMDDIHKKGMKIFAPAIFEAIAAKDKDYFRTTREKRLGMPLEELAKSADPTVLVAAYQPMETYLQEEAFFGGDAPNYADITVLSHLQLPAQLGDANPLPQLPAMTKWAQNCAQVLPDIKRWLAI